MRRYTTGRWKKRGNKVFIEGTTNCVATVSIQKAWDFQSNTIEDHEQEANIQLIEAAPAMYESLIVLKQLLKDGDITNAQKVVNNVLEEAEYKGFDFAINDAVEFRTRDTDPIWTAGQVTAIHNSKDVVYVKSKGGIFAVPYQPINLRKKTQETPEDTTYIKKFAIGQYVMVRDQFMGAVEQLCPESNTIKVLIGHDNDRPVIIEVHASAHNIVHYENTDTNGNT